MTAQDKHTKECKVCSFQAAQDRRKAAAISAVTFPLQGPRIIGMLPHMAALMACAWWNAWGGVFRTYGGDE